LSELKCVACQKSTYIFEDSHNLSLPIPMSNLDLECCFEKLLGEEEVKDYFCRTCNGYHKSKRNNTFGSSRKSSYYILKNSNRDIEKSRRQKIVSLFK